MARRPPSRRDVPACASGPRVPGWRDCGIHPGPMELHETKEGPRRALLLAVQLPATSDAELADSLEELRQLGKTLGLVVGPDFATQRRAAPDPGTYVGSGKLDELKRRVEAGEADLLLIDDEISPSQARNIEKATGAEVMDRTGVILDIF